MKAALKENLNIFLKILPLILIFVFVTSIDSSEFSVIGWLFRMIIIFLLIWKWQNKIRTQTKLRFFKLSFICTLILWIIIIALIIWKNKVGNSYIFLIGIFWFAGMVLTSKALNNSWTTIRKCNPEIRMDTEVHSLDEYFEIYSRAKNLENELSELYPVVNANGYMDSSGKWYSWGEEKEELLLYEKLQYGIMFDHVSEDVSIEVGGGEQ